MNGNLSLLKIISGLSRTIKVANQMLPLYNQIKPIITNGNQVINSISKKIQTTTTSPSTPKQQTTKESTQPQTNTNLPTFFQ